jgi:hypothetical protein
MNVQETTGIRELTTAELDAVHGGVAMPHGWSVFDVALFVTAGIAIVGSFLGQVADWIFGD